VSRNAGKFLIALMLLLNYSLLFGVVEGAHIPDVEHPYGHTVSYDHTGEHLTHTGHADDHEQHHKHGTHIHLGAFIPYSLNFALQPLVHHAPSQHKFLHPSLTYSPPVPPPNH